MPLPINLKFNLLFSLSHPPSAKYFPIFLVCPFFSTHTSSPLIFVDFLYSYVLLLQSLFRISCTLEMIISFYLAKIMWCFSLVHEADVLLNFDLVCLEYKLFVYIRLLEERIQDFCIGRLAFQLSNIRLKIYSLISGSGLHIIKTIILVVELLRLLLLEDIPVYLSSISVRGFCIHNRVRLVAVPHFICKK